LNLVVGLVTGFLVPSFLSIDNYAVLKTFTLYVGYVGILHFGFIDGIYIKYGGKFRREVDYERLKGEHDFLFFFQLAITGIFSLIGFIMQDVTLIAFAICILPINMQTFFGFFYQATGEFSTYSKIKIMPPLIVLFATIFIIYVLEIDNPSLFIMANIVAYYIVFMNLELRFFRRYKSIRPRIYIDEIKKHFRVGFIIMIANLSVMFFYSIDRWFVKLYLSVKEFAFYSFAVSMLMVVNTLINSITLTLYPYLSRNQDENMLSKLKVYFILLGTLSTGAYFVFDFIVTTFLKKYMESLNIISILFAGYPAMIVINALYINLYKARKLEKSYAISVLKMLTVSFLLNVAALLLKRSSEAIAAATTVSFYVWYFYSVRDFPEIKIQKSEIIYLALSMAIFLFLNYKYDWLAGIVLYCLSILTLNMLLYRFEFVELLKYSLGIQSQEYR